MREEARNGTGEFGNGTLGDLARRVEDRGQRVWREHGETMSQAGRRFGYAVTVVVNVLFYYAAHHLLEWNVPFVTEAWTGVLWAVDLSIMAAIAVHAAYIAYNPRWFRHLGAIVTNAFSFVSTYTVWRVFPFDFGAPWNDFAHAVLAISLVIIVAAILINAFQLLTGWGRD